MLKYNYINSTAIAFLVFMGVIFIMGVESCPGNAPESKISVEDLLRLAHGRLMIGDEMGAKKAYEEILAVEPDNIGANFGLGNVHVKLDEPELAEKYYKKAISIEPKNASQYYISGLGFYNLQKDDEAIKRFLKAVELSPGFDLPYWYLAKLYAKKKEYDKSVMYWKLYIEHAKDKNWKKWAEDHMEKVLQEKFQYEQKKQETK